MKIHRGENRIGDAQCRRISVCLSRSQIRQTNGRQLVAAVFREPHLGFAVGSFTCTAAVGGSVLQSERNTYRPTRQTVSDRNRRRRRGLRCQAGNKWCETPARLSTTRRRDLRYCRCPAACKDAGKRSLLEVVLEQSVRRRQHTLPVLFLYDVAFRFEVRIVDI